MSVLGDNIKKERENLGLSREDFAQKIGVSYSAIAMYERGEREPNNEITKKICDLFDCSMDYLMGRTNYRNEIDYLNKNDYLFDEVTSYKKELTDNLPNFSLNNILITMQHFRFQNADPMSYLEKILSGLPIEYKEKAKKTILFFYNIIVNSPDMETEQFRFAYHKEMEGLTDEEISDALKFYKEMKKRVNKDK